MSGRDWASDPATGELLFVDGDIVMTEGVESIRQDVEGRLRLVRGEWFLSDSASEAPEDGIPLFERVLVKSPRPALIASVYRAAISATPGVNAVTSLEVKLNRAARTARVAWTATTDLGLIDGSTSVGG